VTFAPHRWLVRSLIGVASVLGVIAVFAVWANRQLLDNGAWTHTSARLIASPPIREELAVYLTDQLYAHVDVSGEIKHGLPSQIKPLAAPAAGALREVAQKAIGLLLEQSEVQEAWRKANEVAHAQLVQLIENKNKVVKLRNHGTVVLDLRPLFTEVAEKVGAPTSVVEKVPANVAEVRIVRSENLRTMQNAVNALRRVAVILPLLVVALFALAVYLARGLRRQALIDVGVALIAIGLIVIVARQILGRTVVGSLATTEAVRPAAQAAWSIASSTLASIAWSTAVLGIPIILAGMLAGPSRAATGIRRFLAPYLRDRADLSLGFVGFVLLLLFAWGPIGATRSLTGIVVIVGLGFAGAQALRRLTAREFPDARLRPGMFLAPHAEPEQTRGLTTKQSEQEGEPDG
jgi:hypothetical protein